VVWGATENSLMYLKLKFKERRKKIEEELLEEKMIKDLP
jgi:hypothetical protein